MMKKIKSLLFSNENKQFTTFFNYLLAISCVCMTFLLSMGSGNLIFVFIVMLISSVFVAYFCIYKKIQNKIITYWNCKLFILSVVIAIAAAIIFSINFWEKNQYDFNAIFTKLGLEQHTAYF